MDAVALCPHGVAAGQWCADCKGQAAAIPSDPLPMRTGGPTSEERARRTARPCVGPACPMEVEPGHRCEFCATPARFDGPAALGFPWGIVQVADGETLPIGRDPDWSPLAAQIEGARLGWVGRRHAVVEMIGGILLVAHVQGSNPTYLNGKDITSERRPVAIGDRLGFSSRVEVLVSQGS